MELVKAGALDRPTVEAGLREAAIAIGLEERVVDDKLRRAYERVEARDLSRVKDLASRKQFANRHANPVSGSQEVHDFEVPDALCGILEACAGSVMQAERQSR
jgi:hypothetical protein